MIWFLWLFVRLLALQACVVWRLILRIWLLMRLLVWLIILRRRVLLFYQAGLQAARVAVVTARAGSVIVDYEVVPPQGTSLEACRSAVAESVADGDNGAAFAAALGDKPVWALVPRSLSRGHG